MMIYMATTMGLMSNMVSSSSEVLSEVALPFEHTDNVGTFHMKWGYYDNETIVLEFSLPSEIWIGIGIDCSDGSARCDMIIGNADGDGNEPFLYDTYEPHGDRQSVNDTLLGGTHDVSLLRASYSIERGTTLRFSRKVDTGDRFDGKIEPGKPTDIIYAWCAPPFCDSIETAHAPGDWNIITVDLHYDGKTRSNGALSGTRKGSYTTTTITDCTAGSPDLCSCSELIAAGAIESMDECTQGAAVAFCKEHGGASC